MTGDRPKRRSFSANADVMTSTAYARGALTRLTGDPLSETIDVLTHAGCYHITLDLTEVTSIDVEGVNLLAALRHGLSSRCGGLTIINARPTVWGMLQRGHVAADPLTSEDFY